MKVTIKTGKVIPTPPPKKEKKFILELSELDAARIYNFMFRIPSEHVEKLNNEHDLGRVDCDVLDAFLDAGFEGCDAILPKGIRK